MKLTINTTGGSDLTIGDMPDEDILMLLEEFDAGAPRLTFALDNGAGVAHVMSKHITRIDVEGGAA